MYDEIWNTFVSYKNICGAKTRIANGYAPERPIAKKNECFSNDNQKISSFTELKRNK